MFKFKLPLISPLLETIRGSLGRMESKHYTELPPELKNQLSAYLSADEEILLTLRNYRAIHKAPRWTDSNTYFNSWFILTDQRILILRNASSLKIFRDIALDEVSRTLYEVERLGPRVTILTPGKEDRIDFVGDALKHCEDIGKKINEALEKNRQSSKLARGKDTMYCHNCGSRIPKQSKFCSECGISLK